uniref:Uncharacterized protein n=1 Tax=Triticum urartu TaxID=4572 RepID=A0A8R7K1A9_TRIUA
MDGAEAGGEGLHRRLPHRHHRLRPLLLLRRRPRRLHAPHLRRHHRWTRVRAGEAEPPLRLLPRRGRRLRVAVGPPEQDDQEADWAARRLDQRPGQGGDPQDSRGPLLGRRGQWQRQLGLEVLRPCKKRIPLLPQVPLGLVQGGPRRQEGAAGRKGHAAAKSLVHLSS